VRLRSNLNEVRLGFKPFSLVNYTQTQANDIWIYPSQTTIIDTRPGLKSRPNCRLKITEQVLLWRWLLAASELQHCRFSVVDEFGIYVLCILRFVIVTQVKIKMAGSLLFSLSLIASLVGWRGGTFLVLQPLLYWFILKTTKDKLILWITTIILLCLLNAQWYKVSFRNTVGFQLPFRQPFIYFSNCPLKTVFVLHIFFPLYWNPLLPFGRIDTYLN